MLETLSRSNSLNLFSKGIKKTIKIKRKDLKILEEDLKISNNDVSEEKLLRSIQNFMIIMFQNNFI